MPTTVLHDPVSAHVWHTKYQYAEGGHFQEASVDGTWARVALAIAGVEPHHRDDWRERFAAIMRNFQFLPGGRILANAGTKRHATMFNCFAAGTIEDSIQGIFNALRETAVALQAGGGVGVDFSTLRPSGTPAVASNGVASGPTSFMALWEAASAVMESGNVRRGALMATLRCDHPDIESFIDAKSRPGALSHFNLSVLIRDDFMRAVEEDGPWPLAFPLGEHPTPPGAELCIRTWPGSTTPQTCLVYRRVPARALWERLLQAQHAGSEPGVLFVDRMNRGNNLWYCEQLGATNPCGEVPLPPHGACNLGSINLARLVRNPFGAHPQFDFQALQAIAAVATRFLDNVHDLSFFPLKVQEKVTHATRRIGLGVTGLADMLAMLGLRYGSDSSVELTRKIMETIRDCAYRTSVAIAQEKGPFPAFDKTRHAASPFVLELPHDIQDAIAQHGIRNSHLLAVAPAGSISLLAGNVSSGIEPVLAFEGTRRVRGADGQPVAIHVQDPAWRLYRDMHGTASALPDYFVQAMDIPGDAQLRVMAAIQDLVDNAVSKTIRLPERATTQEIGLHLRRAWELGLKGCTVYREGSMGGATVLAP